MIVFSQLWGIACSNNNGMWAEADWIKYCVHVFDTQDQFIRRFGSQNCKNGQFKHPVMLHWIYNSDLYLTVDSYNHRMQKFNIHSKYLLHF